MSLPCMDTHSLLPSSIATPLDIAYAGAHYDLSTYIHELAEACFSTPLSSLDHSASAPASCRKRRAMSDVALELTQFNDGCELNDEVISLDAHSLPQLIHTPNDNHAPNPPTFNAPPHKFSDLEDVLDLLWMQDDTASTTQSASSPVAAASSDHISLISDLDWDYGTNESSSNQGESNDNPSSDNLQSLEVNQEGVLGASSKKEGCLNFNWERSFQNKEEAGGNGIWGGLQHQRVEVTRGSWQGGGGARGSWQKQGGESASWQEKKRGEIRASWQDEIRASWQDRIRASWQPAEGEIRASWHEKKEEGGQNRASWQGQGGLRCKQEERVEGAASVSEKQSTVDALVRSPRSGAWAGPTLFDIESALALNSASPSTTSPSLSSFSPLASPSTPKHPIPPFFDVKKLLSDDLFKASGQYDSLDSSWRLKLQKRNSLEPKYTIKVESEEKALGDGYRWRKYGQKSIKNSPFPRSYYRCSSGKCKAKKQVEKCHEDTRVFVVTYEGIHLHHRPNPSHKFRTLGDLHEDEKEKCASHLCSPSSSASCSYSIPPLCSSSSNHTLLT